MNEPQHTDSSMMEDEIDLIDLLAVLLRRKWLIIGLTFLAAAGSVIYALISLSLPPEKSPLPNLYKPSALVLINEDTTSGGLSSLLAQSGLSSIAGIRGAATGGYGDLAVRLLRSNTIVDTVVEEFGLVERHGIEKFIKGNSRKAVLDRASFTFDPPTRTLTIAYEDIDPVFATELVNRLVELLDRRFATIGVNRSARQRDLLQNKIVDVEGDIASLEHEIQDFQRRYGTINPEIYAREHITVLAEMRARLINKEIEVQTYSEFSRIDDPVVARLRTERDQLQQTISRMEERYFGRPSDGRPGDGGALSGSLESAINFEDIPELSARFGRLERELRVQSRIYEVLTQQYEMARLSADGEDLLFQVLETADVPDLKSGPARSIMVIVATFAGFFLSVFLAFLLNAIENIRKDPERMAKLRGGK